MRCGKVAFAALLVAATLPSYNAFLPNIFSRKQSAAAPYRENVRHVTMDRNSGVSDFAVPNDDTVRQAYDKWRFTYNKGKFDHMRFENFKKNYVTLSRANAAAIKKASEHGVPPPKPLELNEYGDCSTAEYQAMRNGRMSSDIDNQSHRQVTSMQAALEDLKAFSSSASIPKRSEEPKIAVQKEDPDAARIRGVYKEWCEKHGKEFDEDRLNVFSNNLKQVEKYQKQTGKILKLNEYSDLTQEEYNAKFKDKNSWSPTKQVTPMKSNEIAPRFPSNSWMPSRKPAATISTQSFSSSTPTSNNDDVPERVVNAYKQWCSHFGKEFSDQRLLTFQKNFLQVEEYYKSTGIAIKINEYADLSTEEFEIMRSASGAKNSLASSAFEEARKKAEEEDRRKAEEDRRKAEEDAQLKAKKEEEARRKVEEENRIKAEEAKRKAEAEARLKAEEEKRIADEKAKRKAEEEAKRIAEEKAKIQAENEARLEAKRRAEEAALKKKEEERRALDAKEAKLKEHFRRTYKEYCDYYHKKFEESRIPIFKSTIIEINKILVTTGKQIELDEYADLTPEEASARRKAIHEARIQVEKESKKWDMEETRLLREEYAFRQAEAEAKIREEEARLKAIEEAAAEARRREEAEREAERIRAQKEEARQVAEREAKRLVDEARRRAAEAEQRRGMEMAGRWVEEQARMIAEEEARIRYEEFMRKKAETEARMVAEEEARKLAAEQGEAKLRAEARRLAEELAQARAEELEAQLRAEAALRRKAEEEAKRLAEENARIRAEEEARLRAKQEIELEARRKAEDEVKRRAEERARSRDEETKSIIAAAEERARQLEEKDRITAEEGKKETAIGNLWSFFQRKKDPVETTPSKETEASKVPEKVRIAYENWCKYYDKPYEDSRLPVFHKNLLQVEQYFKTSGSQITVNVYENPAKLNKHADRTIAEYKEIQAAAAAQMAVRANETRANYLGSNYSSLVTISDGPGSPSASFSSVAMSPPQQKPAGRSSSASSPLMTVSDGGGGPGPTFPSGGSYVAKMKANAGIPVANDSSRGRATSIPQDQLNDLSFVNSGFSEFTPKSPPKPDRIREAYQKWCQIHGKQFEESRLSTFEGNFLQVERYYKSPDSPENISDSEIPGKLNKHADRTVEEFRQIQAAAAGSSASLSSQPKKRSSGASPLVSVSDGGGGPGPMFPSGGSYVAKMKGLSGDPVPDMTRGRLSSIPEDQLNDLSFAIPGLSQPAFETNEVTNDIIPSTEAIPKKVRNAYIVWCNHYGKKFEEARLPIFRDNLLEVEEYFKNSGSPIEIDVYENPEKLNKNADRTIAEYKQIKAGSTTSPQVPSRIESIPEPFGEYKPVTSDADTIRASYTSWCKQFGRPFSEERLQIFAANLKEKQKYEMESGKTVALNEFSDMTPAEFKSKMQSGSIPLMTVSDGVGTGPNFPSGGSYMAKMRGETTPELSIGEGADPEPIQIDISRMKSTKKQAKVNQTPDRVREAYQKWCQIHGKQFEESRLSIFEGNFLQVERYYKSPDSPENISDSEIPGKLNKHADRTVEEFRQIQAAAAGSSASLSSQPKKRSSGASPLVSVSDGGGGPGPMFPSGGSYVAKMKGLSGIPIASGNNMSRDRSASIPQEQLNNLGAILSSQSSSIANEDYYGTPASVIPVPDLPPMSLMSPVFETKRDSKPDPVQISTAVTPPSYASVPSEPVNQGNVSVDIRNVYMAWCEFYGKTFEEARLPIFESNFRPLQIFYQSSKGIDLSLEENISRLNEYTDRTKDEHKAIQAIELAAVAIPHDEAKEGSGAPKPPKLRGVFASSEKASSPAAGRANSFSQSESIFPNVSKAYTEWCKYYNKKYDESRLPTFQSNFLQVQQYYKKAGKNIDLSESENIMKLNEYADRTKEEYKMIQTMQQTIYTPQEAAAKTTAQIKKDAEVAESASSANKEQSGDLKPETSENENNNEMRDAYKEWCKFYKKDYEESRLPIFETNFRQVEGYYKSKGNPIKLNQSENIVKLNEYADRTVEEYKKIMASKQAKRPISRPRPESEVDKLRKSFEQSMQRPGDFARVNAERKAREAARKRQELRARQEAEEMEKLKAEEEAKLKAEEEAKLKAEEEAKLKAEEEAKLKVEEEAKLKAEEEAKKKAEEEAKLKAEEEAKLKAEEEAKKKAEEEAKLKAEEEAKLKAEEEAKLKAEEEAKLKAKEEAKLKAEEEAKLKAEEEAKLKAEEEAKLKAEEEAKLKAEEEAKKKAEEEAKKKAEEEAKLKAEEEAKLKAEEEAKLKAEEEAKLKAEEEAKLKAEEEAKLKAEEEAKLKAEEEAKLKAEEEAKRKAEEEAKLKAEEEAKLKAEEEAKLKAEEEAKLKAEEEAKLKAEEEAKLKAEEEAKKKAEEEAKLKAEEEAKLKVEEEAKLKAEEEAKLKDAVEAKLKDEVEAKLKDEEEARSKRLKLDEETEKQREKERLFKAVEEVQRQAKLEKARFEALEKEELRRKENREREVAAQKAKAEKKLLVDLEMKGDHSKIDIIPGKSDRIKVANSNASITTKETAQSEHEPKTEERKGSGAILEKSDNLLTEEETSPAPASTVKEEKAEKITSNNTDGNLKKDDRSVGKKIDHLEAVTNNNEQESESLEAVREVKVDNGKEGKISQSKIIMDGEKGSDIQAKKVVKVNGKKTNEVKRKIIEDDKRFTNLKDDTNSNGKEMTRSKILLDKNGKIDSHGENLANVKGTKIEGVKVEANGIVENGVKAQKEKIDDIKTMIDEGGINSPRSMKLEKIDTAVNKNENENEIAHKVDVKENEDLRDVKLVKANGKESNDIKATSNENENDARETKLGSANVNGENSQASAKTDIKTEKADSEEEDSLEINGGYERHEVKALEENGKTAHHDGKVVELKVKGFGKDATANKAAANSTSKKKKSAASGDNAFSLFDSIKNMWGK